MIRKYAEIFCWKNLSSFCSAKATHIFSAKNIRILCIESTKTVNEMTLNELVKLTTLWTTGPRTLEYMVVAAILNAVSQNFFLFVRACPKNVPYAIWAQSAAQFWRNYNVNLFLQQMSPFVVFIVFFFFFFFVFIYLFFNLLFGVAFPFQ